jgi:WD40 repeat protein
MKKLILVIFIITAVLHSAEIIPVWNKALEDNIHDIEILPNGDNFLLLYGIAEGSRFQIRSVEDGELVREIPGYYASFANFELTPDSNRIVVTSGRGGDLELRNLQTFELIKGKFVSRPEGFSAYIKNITIDPIRPYVYVTQYGDNGNSSDFEVKSKVSVYNYETMELVRDLTDYEGYEFSSIAVSDDGKYLATLNNGKAYLKVWDLATMELIRDVQLYDDKLPNNEWWCDSKDIQFSKLNSDVVYYSGRFPSNEQDKFYNGIMTYNIMEDKSTNKWLNYFIGGKFILFDGEKKLMNCNSTYVDIFDLNSQSLNTRISLSIDVPIQERAIYSSEKQIFIGNAKHLIGAIKYDRESNIESLYEEEIIISPNPTNNFVNIELNCIEPLINYQINDINGLIIFQSSIQNQVGDLRIDFTSYPSGVYFITINCGNDVKTYKVVREG